MYQVKIFAKLYNKAFVEEQLALFVKSLDTSERIKEVFLTEPDELNEMWGGVIDLEVPNSVLPSIIAVGLKAHTHYQITAVKADYDDNKIVLENGQISGPAMEVLKVMKKADKIRKNNPKQDKPEHPRKDNIVSIIRRR